MDIQSVDQLQDDKALLVKWANGETQMYPYIWLRDNCSCRTICWHESGLSKRADSKYNIDVEVVPKTLEVTGSSPTFIDVEWSDGHKSRYQSRWLQDFKFDESKPDPVYNPKLRYWGSDVEVEGQLKKFEFNDLMTSDKVLLEWIIELKELGIVLLVNAPKEGGEVLRIAERVNFGYQTHFG